MFWKLAALRRSDVEENICDRVCSFIKSAEQMLQNTFCRKISKIHKIVLSSEEIRTIPYLHAFIFLPQRFA